LPARSIFIIRTCDIAKPYFIFRGWIDPDNGGCRLGQKTFRKFQSIISREFQGWQIEICLKLIRETENYDPKKITKELMPAYQNPISAIGSKERRCAAISPLTMEGK